MSTRRPSPALVTACVALFLSLGGVSWAVATGSVDGREIKDGTVRSPDIRNGTIASADLRNNEVRGVDIRDSAVGGRDVAADTLSGNDIKEPLLDKVPSAGRLDGLDVSQFLRPEARAFRALALNDTPPANGWLSSPSDPVAYVVDGQGYVHIRGSARPGLASNPVFTLPAGARPAGPVRFVLPAGSATANLTIDPTGEATLDPPPSSGGPPNLTYYSFDGVAFAAGG